MSDDRALLEEIEHQEAGLEFSSFSHDDARRLGELIAGLADARHLAVAVDVRRGEQQVFHAAFAGTTADNDSWIVRKNATVRRFEQSSLAVRLKLGARGAESRGLDPAVYAFAGGCVPVKVAGMLVGTASVSGLPDTEDHALVVEAMRAFLQR